jgi:putative chitinase
VSLPQPGWRRCVSCEGMFFIGNDVLGLCPVVGTGHSPAESRFYFIEQDTSNLPAERNWRWCHQCQGLFFGGSSNTAGICPKGGPHDGTRSGEYFLHVADQGAGAQPGWARCSLCKGLFFRNRETDNGVCPSGLNHHALGSKDYAVMLAGSLAFDEAVFLARYPIEFREALTPASARNLSRLLAFMQRDPRIEEMRWLAYMLATAKLECGVAAYSPCRERGCRDGRRPVCTPVPSSDRTYGNPRRCPSPPGLCPAGEVAHTYYGRGYSQLTHGRNYRALGQRLGLGDQLVHFPDNALEPETAYNILSTGMREGLFTGRRLAQFIDSNRGRVDYRGARAIVNPGDAPTFARGRTFARNFETLLDASLR